MGANKEIEIKFRVSALPLLRGRLRAAGFRLKTPRTHEMNSLYDLPDRRLRRKGEVLRLREYGKQWVLTHKAKGTVGRYKTRAETETTVADGVRMGGILRALGFAVSFRYEKFRSEWSDGQGHVVIDETPIGQFGEIEGEPRWIDRTAKALGISTADYITKSYAELFFEWKRTTRAKAREMTFRAVGG